MQHQIETLGPNCCGCGACAAACNKSCITMAPNEKGFYSPIISSQTCISCGACDKTCPVIHQKDDDAIMGSFWAVSKDAQLVMKSSSGGLFGTIAKTLISENNALIVGASFDDEFRCVRHATARKNEELEPLYSSKYVQSIVGADIYRQIKTELKTDGTVFFVGTACQIAGLYAALGNIGKKGKLITAEIICHGVPSPKLWRLWTEKLQNEAGSKLTEVSFRNKATGWNTYSIVYRFDNGKVVKHLASEDWYMRAFLNNASLRPSCLNCASKGRCGADLTLGDYWGIKNQHKDAPWSKGASCIVAHTDTGMGVIDRISNGLSLGASSFEAISIGNPSIKESTTPHPEYGKFQDMLESSSDVDALMEEFPFKRPMISRVASHVHAFLNKVLYR